MNEYNLSLRLQYAVVVAIWSRKKSEYSLEVPLESAVCVCSITVNSSLNLPKFDHCKSCKFLLEFIGVVVVVVVVACVFDHCKFLCFGFYHLSDTMIKFIFLYVVRICGIRNNVEHLCNSNLLLYSMYICTSRNLLQCCTSNSNVVQS